MTDGTGVQPTDQSATARGWTRLEYAAVAVVALIGTYPTLGLGALTLGSAPFYKADGLFHLAVNKSIIEHTWYFYNPRLAAPFGQDFYDFPFPELLHFAILKILSIFTSDIVIVTNIFAVLLFPLTALSARYSLGIMGLSRPISFAISLLYAFQWYHIVRQYNHVMLAAYYMVPPVIAASYLLFVRSSLKMLLPVRLRQRKPWLPVALIVAGMVAVGSSGLYYAVFSVITLMLAGILSALSQRMLRPLVLAACLSAVVTGALLANVGPNLWYALSRGPSSESTIRYAYSAEEHALGLTYLIVPPVLHRLPALSHIGRNYYEQLPDPYSRSEGWSAWLGTLGTLGLGLAVFTVFTPRRDDTMDAVRFMSLLALAIFIIATERGLLPLVAIETVPLIRAPNRLSIFLAFIVLYVLGAYADRWLHRARVRGTARLLLVTACVVSFGLWDQSPLPQSTAHLQTDAQARIAREYVASAEAFLPRGASVFQLPINRFPESAPMHGLGSYEQLRGYLFSDQLRWSSGAVAGRVAGWSASVAIDEPARMAFRLVAAGFSAVEVDRAGYADFAVPTVESFTRVLGPPILTSSDQRIVLFTLQDYMALLARHQIEPALAACAESMRLHSDFFWIGAPSGTEYAPSFYLVNTHAQPELRLRNNTNGSRVVRFQSLIRAWVPDGSPLTITGPNFTITTNLTADAYQFERELTLPPGETRIQFTYGGKQFSLPSDPRKLFLMFVNPVLKDTCDRELNRLPPEIRNLGKPS